MLNARSLPTVNNPYTNIERIYRSQLQLVLGISVLSAVGLSVHMFNILALRPPDDSANVRYISLMFFHLVLHGLCFFIKRRQRLAVAYLFVQIILLFYIGMVVRYPLLTLFLPPLFGEIVAIFEKYWLLPVMVLLAYVLHSLNYLFVFQTADISPLFVLSTMLQLLMATFWSYLPFVGAFMLVVRSRRQTSDLLIKLDIAHRQLAAYAHQIEQLTVTAERARMARELHDTLAQGVTGLIMQLEALDAQLKRGDAVRGVETLTLIRSRARATLKESRHAIDDLRLTPNEPTMIISSLADETRQFSEITGIPCALDVPSNLVLPTSMTEHVLRFVTEGLANIAKHAAASQVSVTMKEQESEISLEIQDNGIGFNPASAAQQSGHYGLLGLQERARLVGGQFEIESNIGKGTKLRLQLPKLY